MEVIPGKKKKRGRKPKNKTIVNTTADFNVNPQEDNLIVSLKKKKTESVEEVLPGFEEVGFSEVQSETTDKQSKCCWNCAHDINREINFPLRYVNGIFYVYGTFCTFECTGRYLMETYNNRDMWDKYVLLNQYYNETNGTKNKRVNPSPDKRVLQKFGGTMTIEEYRS